MIYTTLEEAYTNKNLITRTYFRLKIMLAIKLAELKKTDVILDFGCGAGWLEMKLKDYQIHGYDINPERTFIEDYKTVTPTKIFVLDVLEHIPLEEIEQIVANFKKLNNKFELIVSLPTENWISRKTRKFVGKTEVVKDHITKYREILKVLQKNFVLKKKINLFTVCYIFRFNHDMTKEM